MANYRALSLEKTSCALLKKQRKNPNLQLNAALPPKADIAERDHHVRFVPIPDVTDHDQLINYSDLNPRALT
jgi:hypothetical protein